MLSRVQSEEKKYFSVNPQNKRIIQYVYEESSFLTEHVQLLFSINSSFGNVPAHQYDWRFVLELTVFDCLRYRCRNQVLLHWGKEHTFLLD